MSVWYATWATGSSWRAAVIVGSPENEPQVLGKWANERQAALACLRHARKEKRKARKPKSTAKWKPHQTVEELLERMRALAAEQAAAKARAYAAAYG